MGQFEIFCLSSSAPISAPVQSWSITDSMTGTNGVKLNQRNKEIIPVSELNPDHVVQSLADRMATIVQLALEKAEWRRLDMDISTDDWRKAFAQAVAEAIQVFLPLDLARELANRLISCDQSYLIPLNLMPEDERLHSIQCDPCEECLELAKRLLARLDGRSLDSGEGN